MGGCWLLVMLRTEGVVQGGREFVADNLVDIMYGQ